MTIYKITTPNTSYNGTTGACSRDQGSCLHFAAGTGYTENLAFIDYSAQAGYTVEVVETIPAEYAQALEAAHRHWSPDSRTSGLAL